MDILTAYAGLSLAFVIITSLFLYFIIGSKAPVLVKFVIIPIVIWFTLALYFTPGKLMGWPTPAEPPNNSIILLPIVKEPVGDSKGFIDLLVIVREESKKSLIEQLKPGNVFSYNSKNTERIYRLPYDRDLHKKLTEAQKKARKNGGFMMYSRKGKSQYEDESRIKVINPRDIIKKDDN
jgi:hypothetical protein